MAVCEWALPYNKLSDNSEPLDWFWSFIDIDGKNSLFDQCTKWTNAKGILANFGEIGGPYPTWKPFCVEEVKGFIALYIFNGINISPQMQYKSRSQEQDSVNGNDFIHRNFDGCGGEKRFKHSKALFAI